MNEKVQNIYDKEWVLLIKEAQQLGFTIEEVRRFLQGNVRVEKDIKEAHLQD
ncbi:MerR, DNA binding [Lentibacillus persicus]|uniref:MerR, DNA binding n=1 Tax=Lentibacillus persicus TaxID=640948 RepID=A0A1I1S0Q5_9BACI|nr:anti-repressor SinI family protein [Lentibacillus persicus]SFD40126.1 MerR, DNA binding [Lentibacillus persicus]